MQNNPHPTPPPSPATTTKSPAPTPAATTNPPSPTPAATTRFPKPPAPPPCKPTPSTILQTNFHFDAWLQFAQDASAYLDSLLNTYNPSFACTCFYEAQSFKPSTLNFQVIDSDPDSLFCLFNSHKVKTLIIYNTSLWTLSTSNPAQIKCFDETGKSVDPKDPASSAARTIVAAKFALNTNSTRKVVFVAGNYPHPDGSNHWSSDTTQSIAEMIRTVGGDDQYQVIFAGDFNMTSNIDSKQIFEFLAPPSAVYQDSSKLEPTCCIGENSTSAMTFDRILLGKGVIQMSNPPKTYFPAGTIVSAPGKWAPGTSSSPGTSLQWRSMHAPIVLEVAISDCD